ncbi:hypothetical protein ACWCQ0_15145 [Streptomyces massasporeus]|uniref:hypothetical protein n=1 Tax=Streptomyces massasporeus TaxID=67324 RepID=UPI0033E2ABF6
MALSPFRVPLEAVVLAQDAEEFRQLDVGGDVEPPLRGCRGDGPLRLLGLLPRPGDPGEAAHPRADGDDRLLAEFLADGTADRSATGIQALACIWPALRNPASGR